MPLAAMEADAKEEVEREPFSVGFLARAFAWVWHTAGTEAIRNSLESIVTTSYTFTQKYDYTKTWHCFPPAFGPQFDWTCS